MDDINKTISDIMADPTKVAQLKGMAAKLFGGSAETSPAFENSAPIKESPQQNNGGLEPNSLLFNAKNLGGLISAAGALQNQGSDSSVQLLLALKPHLSKERSDRVDQAVRILRLLKIAPVLKNSGLINF